MIITFNFLFRIITLIFFFLRWCYWIITEKEADRQKPKTNFTPVRGRFVREWFMRIIEVIIILQILGLQVLPIKNYAFGAQIIGFALVVIGTLLSFSARKTLGVNWAHSYEYQIKKEYVLVTNGIYSYIRHSIYTSLGLVSIGGELVAQSYLALIFTSFFIGWYWQARLEEKLLISHFGDSYKTYMKRTKMFIPFLW